MKKRDLFWFLTIVITGTMIGIVFCFIVYPHLQYSYNAVLDGDGYGTLGQQLYNGHGFAFENKTIFRGPFYPFLIAVGLFLSSGWYPGAVWIMQSIFFGLTGGCLYLIAKKIWNGKIGLMTGFGCVCYPMLLWYVPRIWNEVLLAFLLALLVLLNIYETQKRPTLTAVGSGLIIGLLCLTKGVFLLLALVFPIGWYLFNRPKKMLLPLIIFIISISCVLPWTLRNYLLVGKIVPVHTGVGYSLEWGNVYTRDILKSPFSYSNIWIKNMDHMNSFFDRIKAAGPFKELASDKMFSDMAIAEIKAEPILLIKKIVVAGLMIWYLGDYPVKTLVTSLLILPVLIFGIIGIIRALKNKKVEIWPAVVIIVTYWLSYVLFAPPVRLSVPVLPLLLMFAVSLFIRSAPRR
jgi:hypothetical protein